VIARAVVRTRQWPPITMRRMIGTRSVRSRTAVPLITPAIALPPPAAVILFPNPLTTRITPPPAIHRCWCQQKRMLVTVQRDSFANNVQTIIDRFGDREHLKVALRKIAEEVEIVHLAFDPNERMLRTISDVRRPNNH